MTWTHQHIHVGYIAIHIYTAVCQWGIEVKLWHINNNFKFDFQRRRGVKKHQFWFFGVFDLSVSTGDWCQHEQVNPEEVVA